MILSNGLTKWSAVIPRQGEMTAFLHRDELRSRDIFRHVLLKILPVPPGAHVYGPFTFPIMARVVKKLLHCQRLRPAGGP